MPVDQLGGYSFCGSNATLWAEHAGDPNYNLLNQCCLKMNSGNPAELGFTTISQKTMDYMIMDGPGRQDFVRFWRLMAEAVKVRTGCVFFVLLLIFETSSACGYVTISHSPYIDRLEISIASSC